MTRRDSFTVFRTILLTPLILVASSAFCEESEIAADSEGVNTVNTAMDAESAPGETSLFGSQTIKEGSTSLLTVGGEVASTSGGFRFPDSSIQTTAVPSQIADGIDWSEVSQIPAGFQDGIDNIADADSDPSNETISDLSFVDGSLRVIEGGVAHEAPLPVQGSCPSYRYVMLMRDGDEGRNDCDQPVTISGNETVEVVYRQAINAGGTDVVFVGTDWDWSFDQNSLGLPGAVFKGPLSFYISACGSGINQSVVITYKITTECS